MWPSKATYLMVAKKLKETERDPGQDIPKETLSVTYFLHTRPNLKKFPLSSIMSSNYESFSD
jgi:hypothetical protein